MHKSATKYNETIGKWCKNKHGASKIIDMLETWAPGRLGDEMGGPAKRNALSMVVGQWEQEMFAKRNIHI
jgi:hypothetical protein